MSAVSVKTDGKSSSVSSNPTFRDMAMNTVAIVPLLSHTTTQSSIQVQTNYSMKSFDILMESLERYALQRAGGQDISSITSSSSSYILPTMNETQPSQTTHHDDIDIIIPNEQLTRPGDWKYDNTPLRSHAWHSGCQRMVCFDGREFTSPVTGQPYPSPHAQDRLSKNPMYEAFADLYPSRGTSAVIGVISVRDCTSIQTVFEAERELSTWVDRYTLQSYKKQVGQGLVKGYDTNHPDPTYEEKMHKVIRRIFIFDTFEDTTSQNIDLSKTPLFKSGELIAFPPTGTHMMDLHLNVVLNDLAVAIFLQLEDRIRLCDGGKNKSPPALSRKGSSGSITEPVGPTEKLGISNLVNLVGSGNNNVDGSARMDGKMDDDDTSITSGSGGASGGSSGGGLGLFGSAMKALGNTKGSEASEYLLFTPVDTKLVLEKISSKEMEYLIRRNQGRREKYAGDLCLLAGSPMDAFERYTRATELSKRDHDPLFYAASLEGCAASFIAMSDTGGHGVDEYLDENFQYPDDVMAILLSNQQGVDSKMDKTKTTMPAAIVALMEEAFSVVRCHIQLSSIHSELLLKMAWYTSELEGSHLRCRWGEGCYEGLDTNRINEPKRWQKASVAKLTQDGSKGLLDPLLSAKYFAQCQKFCELLHRATFNGGLDLFTRSCVASRCASLCQLGIKAVDWTGSLLRNSFSCTPFPRKSAFFAFIAAESLALSKVSNTSLSNHLWLYAFSLHSLEENMCGSSDKYAWSSIRAILLHAVIQRTQFSSAENAVLCLLHLLSEISGNIGLSTNYTTSIMDLSSLKSQGSVSEADIDIPDTLNKVVKKDITSRRSNPTRSRFSVQGVTSFAFLQSKWLDDEHVPMITVPFIDPSFIARLCKDELKSHPYVKDLILSVNRLPSYPSMNSVIPFKPSECLFMSDNCIKYLDKKFTHDFESHPLKATLSFIDESPIDITSINLLAPESHLSLERVKADISVKPSSTAMKAVFFNKQNNATKIASDNVVSEGDERIIEIGFDNKFLVSLYIQNCHLIFDCNGKYRVEAIPQSFVVPPRAVNFVVKFPFLLLPYTSDPSESLSNQGSNDSLTLSGLRLSYLRKSRVIQFESDASSVDRSHSRQVADPVSLYKRSPHNCKLKKKAVKNMSFEPLPAQPYITLKMTSMGGTELQDGFMMPVELSESEIYTIPEIQFINGPGSASIYRLQILTLTSSGVPIQTLYDSSNEISSHGDSTDTKKQLRRGSTSLMDELNKTHSIQLEASNTSISLDSLNNRDAASTISCIIRATSPGAVMQADGSIIKLRFRYRGQYTRNGLEYWRRKDISFRIVKTKGPRISSITLRPDLSWSGSYGWLGASKRTPTSQSDFIDYQVANDGIVSVIEVVNESSSDIVLTNHSEKVRNLQGGPLSPVKMASGAIVQIPIILPRKSQTRGDDHLSSTVAELSRLTLFDWVSDVAQNMNLLIKPVTCDRCGVLRISHSVLEAIGEQRTLIGIPPFEIIVNMDHQEFFHPGDAIKVSAKVKVSDWIMCSLVPQCLLLIELICYKKETTNPFLATNDFIWSGQNKIAQQLAKGADVVSHEARLCFLSAGHYTVTAFAYFSGNNECPPNERWLAKDACTIEVREEN